MAQFILRWPNESVSCLATASAPFDEKAISLVLAGSQSGRVSVWRVDSRRALVDSQLHAASVLSLELLAGEQSTAHVLYVLSLARDGRLLMWTIARHAFSRKSRTDSPPALSPPVLLLSANSIGFCGFATLLERPGASGTRFLACLPPQSMSAICVHPISFSAGHSHSPALGEPVALDPTSVISSSSDSGSSTSSSVGSVMALRFCGSCLLAALENGHLVAWFFRVGGASDKQLELLSSSSLPLFSGPLLAFDVCPTSGVGAAGSASRALALFSVRGDALTVRVLVRIDLLTASPQPIGSFAENPEEATAVCSALAFSADGAQLAVALESAASSASPESAHSAAGSHFHLELYHCSVRLDREVPREDAGAREVTGSFMNDELRLKSAHCPTGRLRALAFSLSRNDKLLFGANESCIEAYPC